MDFGGGPLWDGTALVDMLSFEPVPNKKSDEGSPSFVEAH